MKFYQIEYRQDSEQMLWSEDTENKKEAFEMFERAKFNGKCDIIELWLYFEDNIEGKLLKTKEL